MTDTESHKRLVLQVNVVRVGDLWIAGMKIGGVSIRGRQSSNPTGAVLQMFASMGTDDAALGVELALAGTTLDEQLSEVPQLEKGSE